MPLYHTDDQAMLADTARGFIAEEGNITKQLRHWRDRNCKDGFGHGLWKQMAEMGFTGMLVDEGDGGLGMGHVEAGIVLEEIGRNLTPSPFLTSSVLAATALKHGSADLKGRYLPGLIAGDGLVHGELLRIDDPARLPALDDYEECGGPEPLFRRERMVARLGDGTVVDAWGYRYARPPLGARVIAGGDYAAHLASR